MYPEDVGLLEPAMALEAHFWFAQFQMTPVRVAFYGLEKCFELSPQNLKFDL